MSDNDQPEFPKVCIGISSCLLGQEVRYNGGHKRDGFVADVLSRFADYLPVCPEVAIGLGIPRPPIRLVGDPDQPRAVGADDPSLDVTERLEAFSRRQVAALQGINGYILMKDSPSCGMDRVKVYGRQGGIGQRKGMGIYARILTKNLPELPVEEEGRLKDPVLRENFLARVYVQDRWQRSCAAEITPGKLIAFHSDHKYLVMAHSQAAYKRLGQLLANLRKVDLETVAQMYFAELMSALRRRVDRKRHVNVLQHMLGYLKKSIDSADKAELLRHIEAYCDGTVPLIVPITFLRHHFRRRPDPYMERQVYLHPYPDELALRNAI